jgi:hypothetical protein
MEEMIKGGLGKLRNRFFVLGLGGALLFSFFGLGIKAAEAASLYFSPSSGTYTVGNIFTVTAYTDTQGQAINNAEAIINFPTDYLSVVSVNPSGSIFNLWVQTPNFSNEDGTISFNGGLPTPGYTGPNGKLCSIVFRVRKPGTASLVFASSAVRANDGYGTDVLKARGQATFTLVATGEKPVEPAPTPTPVPGTNVPGAPFVSSPTHPDQEKWYNNNSPEFRWAIGADINGVNVLADREPRTNPGTKSDGVMTRYAYSDVDDGNWYFHIRLRNSAGWGGVTHFRFNIDTEPPTDFVMEFPDGKESENPQIRVALRASDSLSGVDYYKLKIDENEPVIVKKDELKNGVFVLPAQAPGKHSILAQVYDAARNYSTLADEFIIKALAPPTLTGPQELEAGNILVVRGTAAPSSTVEIHAQKVGETEKSQMVTADADGNFSLVWAEKVREGVYEVWADYTTVYGAKSAVSQKLVILVKPSLLLKIGISAVIAMVVMIILLSLLLLLLLILWYIWRKMRALRKAIHREVEHAETDVHRAFDKLRDNVQKQIKLLEKTGSKRELTMEEEKVLKKLKKDLDEAEALIEKEIEDIEKKIK